LPWKVEFEKHARKEFLKLGYPIQNKILRYLSEKVKSDPVQFGKPLKGTLSGLRRYRVEGYRIVCRIENDTLTVVVVRVAHRSSIYK